ncbi:GIY-YIG nuclease family protein [Candidatus Kaiserbacteria bacterium]|nr:GIY-YIG nuclease family protein [Candidatus Kaiserbacteria bacterium]
MNYVYVLRSKVDKELYIGSTNDLRRRLSEHNEGKVYSTRLRIPFELVYYEAYLSENDARIRESRLKQRGQARVHLLNRLKDSLQGES